MKNVRIIIRKKSVMEEVAKSTAYAGAKGTPDGSGFERIATAEEDSVMLARFWDEASATVASRLREFTRELDYSEEAFRATLELSSAYDDTQTPALSSGLFSYLTTAIIAKWYSVVSRDDSETLATEAAALLDEAASRCYHRSRPKRRR